MLGGLLHAAHIPFRGMVISSVAIVIVCLIVHFSNKRGEIMKAMIIVLIIKAIISPHTPVAAYLAVFLQGLMGEILFLRKNFFSLSCVILGLIVGILTGSQKIITYTLIFGVTFWEAINEFITYVIEEFFLLSSSDISFNFSLLVIAAYILIHVLFGIAAGLLASKMPQKLNSDTAKAMLLNEKIFIAGQSEINKRIRSRKPWWKKLSYDLIMGIIIILLIITYINPQVINLSQKSLLLMVIRATIITITWFYFLSPFILKLIKKLLHKKENAYMKEVKGIISHFPFYKMVVAEIWKMSSKKKGIARISYFITALIANILALKFPD